jgi:predicted membrane-bound spermidine synthase
MRLRAFAFVCFFLSGFCSLVYQIVWTRLAMASYGVNSQVIATVLSVFMFGLGVGSWLGGAAYDRFKERPWFSPLAWYAGCELLIGVGSVTVPALFLVGREQLLGSGGTGPLSYLVQSGLILFVAMAPWCVCMGATVPLMMGFLKETDRGRSENNFSFLYLANVLGATVGSALPVLVMVETLGFHRSLLGAGALNVVVVLTCAAVFAAVRRDPHRAAVTEAAETEVAPPGAAVPLATWMLFTTGFVSMGMEVAWARMFAPFLGNEVYGFAGLLVTYLVATFLGSWVYRLALRFEALADPRYVWLALFVAAGLPLLTADPRTLEALGWTWPALTVLGIAPFCFLLGFLTPLLVDRYSRGRPGRTGRAYAYNVFGCILGPVVAGFVLMPAGGAFFTVVIMSALLLLLGAALLLHRETGSARRPRAAVAWAVAIALFAASGVWAHGSEREHERHRVKHDYTATVTASGSGMDTYLLVNGVGMTIKTTITKMMAHLPLAHLERPPRNALVICFGMGTTFRSLLSWGIDTTAVELVPSVAEFFPFYYEDAGELLALPRAHLVVDDGRRFLDRSSQQFDVILLDPPPPAEAAGSSLLYSKEFYDSVKKRLAPGGILQQWLPGEAEPPIAGAVANTLAHSFPHIRAYHSVTGWGVHFLASMEPIPERTAEELAARLPEAAARDLVEWEQGEPGELFAAVLGKQVSPVVFDEAREAGVMITDDRPFNEYYWLRRNVGARATASGFVPREGHLGPHQVPRFLRPRE